MNNTGSKTILLVEDEAIIALNQKKILENNGFRVKTAFTGEKAVDMATSDPEIDLVLMDIDLGKGIDGTVAAQRILDTKEVPIIFLSSHTEPDVVDKTEKITSYGYIVKNTGETVLIASIKMAFRLFDAKVQESTATKKLSHSRDMMRYVIEHDRSAIAIHDKELRYLYVSDRYMKAFQVKEKQVIGKHHYEIFPDLPDKWRKVHERALNGEVCSAEDDLFIRADGTELWTRWECRPWFENDGSIGGIIINTEIINPKKDVEKALENASSYLHTILEAIPDGFWVLDTLGNFREVNTAYCKKSGYSRQELLEMTITDVDADETPEDTQRRIVEVKQKGAQTFKVRHKKKDGNLWHLEVAVTLIHDGEERIVCFARDLSERLSIQAALEENESRFQNIMNSIQDIVFTLDTEQRHTGVFGPWVEKSGLTPDDFIGKTTTEILGEKNQEIHTEAFARALTGEFTVYEWSVTNPGEERYFQTSLSPIFRHDGTITGLIGIGRDVTEQKMNQLNYQMLFNEMLDGFAYHEIICNEDGKPVDYRFLDVNPAFEKMTGLLYDDVANQTVFQVLPETEEYWIETYGRVAQTGEAVHFENYSSQLNKHFEIKAFCPHRGTFACIFTDITDKKTSDALIQQSEIKYRTLFEVLPAGITISDPKGNIVESNALSKKLLGLDPEEQKKRTIDGVQWKIITPDYTPMNPGDFASTRALKEQRLVENMEMGIDKGSEGITWLTVNATPIPLDNYGVAIAYIDVTKHREADEQIRALLQEKNIILKEAHHRVKNNITTIISLLSFQASTATSDHCKESLNDAGRRLQSMMLLYDKLYRNDSYTQLNIRDFFPSLIREILQGFSVQERIKTVIHLEDLVLSPQYISVLGIFLNELITNSMKYAFPDSRSGTIHFTIAKKNSQIIVEYRDDGIGLPRDITFETTGGFGLQLVNMLSEQLDGTIEILRDKGTGFRLTFGE